MAGADKIKHSFRVSDRWIFIFVYPVMAILAVHVGNENTLKELLLIPSYYSDLVLAFLSSYGIGFYYHWFFIKVDRRFNWDTEMRKRFVYQVLFGVCAPIIVLIGFEIIYLEILLEIPLNESSVFYLELPLVAVFCILINLIYMILYFRKHHQTTTEFLKKQNAVNSSTNSKSNIVVNTGQKSLNLGIDEVAYFIILEKSTFLVTRENRQYLYDVPLDQVEKDISSDKFFQINRQIISHRQSIVSFERTETRKLKIEMNPPTADPVFVSKAKSSRFMNWVNQK
jgi:hypothetical protein